MTLDLLALFDSDERIFATSADTRREELPGLVRHVDLVGASSCVLYSRLSSDNVDGVIRDQLEYFGSLGHDLEWKAFAHDEPADLIGRLKERGFGVEETEAVLVLDVTKTPAADASPTRVRRIARPDQLGDVARVRHSVYPSRSRSDLVARLAREMERTPDGISVYVADVDGAAAACAWIRFPRSSAFASLWGGSTVPLHRNRGLYSELLAIRIQAARERGFRYLTVDARSMSRPILEKHGFALLTSSTPCTWSARGVR